MSKARNFIITYKKTEFDLNDASEIVASCYDRSADKADIVDKESLIRDMHHCKEPGLSVVQLSDEMSTLLKNHSFIANIIEDFEFSLPQPDYSPIGPPEKVDSLPWDWNIRMINASKAWEKNLTGNGVTIAVVYTGIDIRNQPTLASRVIGGISYADGKESTDPHSWQDTYGHGTLCAGIMATPKIENSAVGVAQNASLYSVKITDSKTIKMSNLVKGMQWIIGECKGGNRIDIASMSVGLDLSRIITGDTENGLTELERLVQSLLEQNCLVVAPVGNNGNKRGETLSVTYPAHMEGVLGVGAVDTTGKWWSSSSWEKGKDWVNITAPGVGIFENWTGVDPALPHDGSCFSCAHTSGAAALVIEYLEKQNQPYTTEMVAAILEESALDIDGLGRDSRTGAGILNCDFSISVAESLVESLNVEHMLYKKKSVRDIVEQKIGQSSHPDN